MAGTKWCNSSAWHGSRNLNCVSRLLRLLSYCSSYTDIFSLRNRRRNVESKPTHRVHNIASCDGDCGSRLIYSMWFPVRHVLTSGPAIVINVPCRLLYEIVPRTWTNAHMLYDEFMLGIWPAWTETSDDSGVKSHTVRMYEHYYASFMLTVSCVNCCCSC